LIFTGKGVNVELADLLSLRLLGRGYNGKNIGNNSSKYHGADFFTADR
jgi:hypothetical protein